MKKKSIALNALLNGIKGILNILFPLITFPYISRVLSVKGVGIYNFSSSYVSYFSLIASLGVSTYAIREGVKYRNDYKKISRFCSEVFTINIYSTILSYILLFFSLLIFTQLHDYFSCIIIFSLEVLFTTLGVDWIYQVFEDYMYITLRSVIFQILSIILLFVFVRDKNDYLNYTLITVFSIVGSSLLNFFHVKHFCKIKFIKKFNYKKHLIPILIFFGLNIANEIYINSDTTILGILKTPYEVGIFSVSARIYSIIKALIISVLLVTVPRCSYLISKNKIKEYITLLSNILNYSIFLALPASVGLFMMSKEVVIIISGIKYLSSITSLRIFSFSFMFGILSWLLMDCVLIPNKKEKKVLISMIVSATINIILDCLLIPQFNENAAAFSTIISDFSMFLVNYHYSREIFNKIFFCKKTIRNLITVSLSCIGIIFVCLIVNFCIKGLILKTVLSVIFSVIVYLVMLFILKNNILKNLWILFKKH